MKTIFNGENNHSILKIIKLLYFENHEKNKSILDKKLSNYYSRKFTVNFFTTGRCSLYKLLNSLNLGKNYKVAIQAFTCSVVPKAVIDAGGMPEYVDIEINTLSMEFKELEKKVNQFEVVILQYTFGITPKYLRDITNLCNKHSKILILDKAHCMPEIINQEIKLLESLAYGIFYSTDHTKAINVVRGGICFSKKESSFFYTANIQDN